MTDILSVSTVKPVASGKDDGQNVRPTSSQKRAPVESMVIIPVPVQKLIAETFDSELLALMVVYGGKW